MALRVDMMHLQDGKEDECYPFFEMRDGVVRPLSPAAEEFVKDGITIDGRTFLFPKDGRAFMEALPIAIAGSYAWATQPYETE